MRTQCGGAMTSPAQSVAIPDRGDENEPDEARRRAHDLLRSLIGAMRTLTHKDIEEYIIDVAAPARGDENVSPWVWRPYSGTSLRSLIGAMRTRRGPAAARRAR